MSAAKPLVVKKKREVKEKNSEDEEEDWSEWDRRQSDHERAQSPGANSGKDSDSGRGEGRGKKYKKYWSQLLGCHIQAERKKKRPKILVLGELFGSFLKEHDICKEERLEMIKEVVTLLRKPPNIKPRESIAISVRQRVAEERRCFRFGEDNTEIITAQKKKNAAELQLLQVELKVTEDFMKGIESRDRRRKKRALLEEAAAKMGMTIEELEAARAKFTPQKDEKENKKSKPGAASKTSQMRETSPQRANESPLQAGDESPLGKRQSYFKEDTMSSQPRRTFGDSFAKSSTFDLLANELKEKAKLEQWRKANTKVLAVLGFQDTKEDVEKTINNLSENTAEQDLELRATVAAHMEQVATVLHAKAELDAKLAKFLSTRSFQEKVYGLLLEYLNTLPPLDKDGLPMSIASLKDILKMQRRRASQLAINRIRVRFGERDEKKDTHVGGLERPVASNDAFLGRNELLRVSALLRSCMYVKSWMLLYRHSEHSKAMRAIGAKIGFNSSTSLRQKVLKVLRNKCVYTKEMRAKLKDARGFFACSLTFRNECFRLWVQVHKLARSVDSSRLKALASSNSALAEQCFEAWQRLVLNKKRALSRWTNGTLLWAFREWAAAVLDVHDLEAQLNSKCGGRLLAQGRVLRGIIFREWLLVVYKKKKALKRWKHQALVQMFTDWAGLCAERWERYARVQDKCKGVAARLKGAWRDLCFHAWAAAVLKDRRARARFVNATLYMCLSSWKALSRELKRQRQLLARIKTRIQRRSEIGVLQAYREVVAQRVHMKKTLRSILQMWIDKGKRVGYRVLSLNRTVRQRHREIVALSLERLARFRWKVAFAGLDINRAQEVRVRVVLARIRWRPAAIALEAWSKLVMDIMFAHQRALADKSPIIARFLKRCMVDAFFAWHTLAAAEARRRRIIKSIATRVKYAAAIAALQKWAGFMEDMYAERHEELVLALNIALKNGDIAVLQGTLARHFHLPHVRAKYKQQSMRDVMSQVLLEGGASPDAVAALRAASASHVEQHETSTPGLQRNGRRDETGVLRDEEESVVRFKEIEGRKHLRTAFANTMRRSVEQHKDGGITWREPPPPRPAALLRDAMGELLEEQHVLQRRAGGLELFPKAQRLDTGHADVLLGASAPRIVRDDALGAALATGREHTSHSDATQWVLGVVPSMKIVNKMGVVRSHADSYYASSRPVPVTDSNYKGIEVKLGARHRILDLHDPLPPRVFKTSAPRLSPDVKEGGGEERRGAGKDAWAGEGHDGDLEVAVHRPSNRPHGNGLRTALSAADLIGFEDDRYEIDASKYISKTASASVTAQDRLSRFRSVLNIPDPRASVHKISSKKANIKFHAGTLGELQKSLWLNANTGCRDKSKAKSREPVNFERFSTAFSQRDPSRSQDEYEGSGGRREQAFSLPLVNTAVRTAGGHQEYLAAAPRSDGLRSGLSRSQGARTALGLVSSFEKSHRLLARLGSVP